ncbi:hypothetical protein CsSME_00033002 [Camellia sinensis var. sinensis]
MGEREKLSVQKVGKKFLQAPSTTPPWCLSL